MKKILGYIALAALVSAVVSCSQEPFAEEDTMPNTRTNADVLSEREANLILVEYLTLDADDQFILPLTEKQAADLGVSKAFYAKAVATMEEANRVLNDFRQQNPGIEVPVVAPGAHRNDDPIVYSAKATFPTGNLSTEGQEEAIGRFWAPYEQTGVNFLCRNNVAFICTFLCKTYSLGIWNVNTGGGGIAMNVNVKVPLAASSTSVEVRFSVTDPNGGSAYYTGY